MNFSELNLIYKVHSTFVLAVIQFRLQPSSLPAVVLNVCVRPYGLIFNSVCCNPDCLLHNFVWGHLYCQGLIFAGLPPSSSTALLFLLPTFSFSGLLKKRVFRAALIRCLCPGSLPLPSAGDRTSYLP
jgi:hypothetical protein